MKSLYLVLALLLIVIIVLIIDYRSGGLFGFKLKRTKMNEQEITDENENFYPYGFNYDIYGTDDYSTYYPWYGYGYPWYNGFYSYW